MSDVQKNDENKAHMLYAQSSADAAIGEIRDPENLEVYRLRLLIFSLNYLRGNFGVAVNINDLSNALQSLDERFEHISDREGNLLYQRNKLIEEILELAMTINDRELKFSLRTLDVNQLFDLLVFNKSYNGISSDNAYSYLVAILFDFNETEQTKELIRRLESLYNRRDIFLMRMEKVQRLIALAYLHSITVDQKIFPNTKIIELVQGNIERLVKTLLGLQVGRTHIFEEL